MHKSETVLENKIHKILWGFDIKQKKGSPNPDLVVISKKK